MHPLRPHSPPPPRRHRHHGDAACFSYPLLAALKPIDGLTLGLLTGNYPETGRLKIAAAGLDPDGFAVAAWGTDGRERRALPRVALERHNAFNGRRLTAAEVVVVGDTPPDVDCAHANGCRVLAVVTGRYSVADLEQAGADLAVESLAATPDLVRWIGGR